MSWIMLPLGLSPLPPTPSSAPALSAAVANPLAGALISDASAAARQQLPNAVAASGAPAAYAPHTPPAPKSARAGNGAQSPLAAQLLAQDNALPEESIFDAAPAMPAPLTDEPQAMAAAMREAGRTGTEEIIASTVAEQAPLQPILIEETKPGGRKLGMEARGANAYRVAAQRTNALPPILPVAD